MKSPRHTERFFDSTRGRLVLLLRQKARTAAEMASEIGMTGNGVRLHLATLERDGLVRRAGERPGTRKPHHLYALTEEAESLFPKVYDIVLGHLLGVLKDRLDAGTVGEILAAAGRRLGAVVPAEPETASDEERLAKAVAVIGGLGGTAHIERDPAGALLCGASCPLRNVTTDHDEVCAMLASALSAVIGLRVEPCCEGLPAAPRCRFRVFAR